MCKFLHKGTIFVSDIPADGLSFFHGLCNWIEHPGVSKLVSWKCAQKSLSKLTCIKSKLGEQVKAPKKLPNNTLYVPSYTGGRNLFKYLRNAFCHNSIKYDASTKQYRIAPSDKVKIAGQFSLEAIKELESAFFPVTSNN